MEHSIFCLDEHGTYEYTFSEEQEKELCEGNTEIRLILQDGEKIYESVYEQCDVEFKQLGSCEDSSCFQVEMKFSPMNDTITRSIYQTLEKLHRKNAKLLSGIR